MKEKTDSRPANRFKIVSVAASAFSGVVGISGLAGSAFHVRGLVTWGVEPVTMKVNAAVCFLLAAVALWLLREEGSVSHGDRTVGRVAACLLGGLALLSGVEFLLDRDFHIDQPFIPALPDPSNITLHPGLMSPITAFNFVLLAGALLLIDWRIRNRDWPAQYLCLLGVLGSCVGVLGLFLQPLPAAISPALPTCRRVCRVDVRNHERAGSLGHGRAADLG